MASFTLNVPYGKVVGRFGVAIGDGIDSDVYPDTTPPSGTVTFTPTVPKVLVATGAPDPITLELQPITATLDSSGYLTFNGQQGVWLVATDSTVTNPYGWTYTVQYNISYSGGVIDKSKFDISVPTSDINTASTWTDLTIAAPVPTSTGTPIVVGPPGPVPNLNIGTVTTGTPAASITGTATDKRLNLVLPSGSGGVTSFQDAQLTGTPTAPTPPTGDNNTKIATTAFVQNTVASLTASTPNTGSVGYNASTHTWPARPAVPNGPVEWRSTNDASAIQPPGMLIGDSWVQHPDAV